MTAPQGHFSSIEYLDNKSLFWSLLSPHKVWAWSFSTPVLVPNWVTVNCFQKTMKRLLDFCKYIGSIPEKSCFKYSVLFTC